VQGTLVVLLNFYYFGLGVAEKLQALLDNDDIAA
jgi:hypothetical protein